MLVTHFLPSHKTNARRGSGSGGFIEAAQDHGVFLRIGSLEISGLFAEEFAGPFLIRKQEWEPTSSRFLRREAQGFDFAQNDEPSSRTEEAKHFVWVGHMLAVSDPAIINERLELPPVRS